METAPCRKKHLPESLTADPESRRHSSGILLVLMLVCVGATMSWVTFSWEGLVVLLAAMVAFVVLQRNPSWIRVSPESLLTGILIGFTALICFLRPGRWLVGETYQFAERSIRDYTRYAVMIRVLGAAALMISLTYLSALRRRQLVVLRFVILVLVAVSFRVLILKASPQPRSDHYVAQTLSASRFSSAESIYTMDFPSTWDIRKVLHGYPGFPVSFYPALLSWRVCHDVRWAWVVSDLLAALLVFMIARRTNPTAKRIRELVTLAVLFFPRTPYLLEQSACEPLYAFFLAAFALAWTSEWPSPITGGALGLFLASTPYSLFILPVLFTWARLRVLVWAVAVATVGVFAVPLAHGHYSDMLRSAFGPFTEKASIPLPMSILPALARIGVELPWWWLVIPWAAAILFFVITGRNTTSGRLFALAGIWIFFFMFEGQAFMKHYHMIMFTLALSVAAQPHGACGRTLQERRYGERAAVDVSRNGHG